MSESLEPQRGDCGERRERRNVARAPCAQQKTLSRQPPLSPRARWWSKKLFFLRVQLAIITKRFFVLYIVFYHASKTPKRFFWFLTYMFFMCLRFFRLLCISSFMYMQVAIRHGKDLGQSRLLSSGAKKLDTKSSAGK